MSVAGIACRALIVSGARVTLKPRDAIFWFCAAADFAGRLFL
jgi:hypothetical protein